MAEKESVYYGAKLNSARFVIFPLRWRRGAVSRVSDLRSRGRGFESPLGGRRKNSGQVFHTYVPLSPSSISWYRPKGGDAFRLGSKGRYGSCVGGR